MSYRTFFLFLISNVLIVVLFLWLTYYAIKTNSARNAVTVDALESRINQVIIQTLKTVRDDIGLLAPAPVQSTTSGEEVGEKEEKEKKPPQLEGVENLSIIGDEFFLDGRRFSAGQCVYPWGVCIAVLPTSVVFVGMDGETTIVCKSGRANIDNFQKPDKARQDDSKSAAPLSV